MMARFFLIMMMALLTACAGTGSSLLSIGGKKPSLSVGMQANFAGYVQHKFPLAFAVANDGGVSSAWVCRDSGSCKASAEVYRQRAKESCEKKAHGLKCMLYADGQSVLWAEPHRRDAMPRHRLVAPREAREQGPDKARGAIVYLPGYGGGRFPRRLDYSLISRHMLDLNRRGWDLYRLNFAFYDYGPQTLELVDKVIVAQVKQLRQQGYRRVLLSGQSRGAWNLLRLARQPGIADGYFIDVPAAHGRSHSWDGTVNRNAANAVPDFRKLIAEQAPVPLLFSFFTNDPFYAGDKVGVLKSLLSGRLGKDVFVIDHPTGITGHGGASRAAFVRGYGDCLASFAEDGKFTLDTCHKPQDFSRPENLTNGGHARAQGWRAMTHKELTAFSRGLAIFARRRQPNWAGTYFASSQKTLSWLPGEYVAGNVVRAEWQVTGGKLCFVRSRRHHSNNYCYTLMRSRSDLYRDQVVFVSPYDEAYRLTFRHYKSEKDFDFQPGRWQDGPLSN